MIVRTWLSTVCSEMNSRSPVCLLLSPSATSRAVTGFRPGDEVYGGCGLDLVPGTTGLAEYACLRQDGMLRAMPAGLTFEQAAAVPVAALTALQGLSDKGRVRRGHRVLAPTGVFVEAVRYLERGHARGEVVVTMDG
ncbi:hypothetical protein [Planobispora rosea]|uniref:hypothetical protein n=1 Tax=Planobispora rosea TaxID=35762 RepID=UPI001FD5AD3D|nr:hypothetical protein [Planobispora rosea]